MISRIVESPFTYARVAGLTYLLIIILGVLNSAFIDSKLIVFGSDTLTANNILANDFLFRVGMVCVLILYASVVVLSLSLYLILKPIHPCLALLAMILRMVEATLGAATVLISLVVLAILKDANYSPAFEPGQLEALAGVFLGVRTAGLDLVLVFVGLGGAIFCYLFYKSKYIPKALAVWGMFTYLSMIMLAFISILVPNHSEIIEIVLYGFGALFEVIIGLWLLIKGIDVRAVRAT